MQKCLFSGLTRINGFTLAEVLITLGIIGIVAAMTMPTLMTNYRKKQISTRLKKFNSMMAQAVTLSEAHNGDSKDWEISKDYLIRNDNGEAIRDEKGEVQYDDNKGTEFTYPFILKYFAPYIKYTKIEKALPVERHGKTTKYTTIYFADGSVVNVKLGACIDWIYDINGTKAPNETGQDIFNFILCPWKSQSYFARPNKKWGPYYDSSNRKTRDAILNKCKSSGAYCTLLLEHDGWEFKNDYPYKL